MRNPKPKVEDEAVNFLGHQLLRQVASVLKSRERAEFGKRSIQGFRDSACGCRLGITYREAESRNLGMEVLPTPCRSGVSLLFLHT